MKAQLHWSYRARRDLKDIYKWIARDRPLAGERIAQQIRSRVLILQNQPFAGEARPDISFEVRALIEPPYLILYALSAKAGAEESFTAEILRILHGSMSLPNALH